MNRTFYGLAQLVCLATLIWFAFGQNASAVKIWESTFDSTADGVVDIADNDFGKDMIGPVTNGRLQITAWDNTTDQYTPDKAGRPLMLNGSQMPISYNGDHSMSGQYKFRWSEFNQSETQAYEFAGFLGNTTIAQTRQVMGSLLRHWTPTGTQDHYVALDVAVGSVGYTNFGYKAGPATFLGSDPTANDYELRVEYDGTTHHLSLTLLNNSGVALTTNSVNLLTDVPGLQGPGSPAQELGALALTHLGWEDYTGNGGNRATVWQVDSLAYYDTAQVPGTNAPNADYNHNGVVDAADYVVWRKNLNATGTPGTVAGDGTSTDLLGVPDGHVDQFDYNFWRSRFGNPSGSGTAISGRDVPEPTSAMVIAAGMSILLTTWRLRFRQE
jgi:hypothetical protein